MTSARTFIVGGSLTGAKTEEASSDKDFDGSIILLTEEEHLAHDWTACRNIRRSRGGLRRYATAPATATCSWNPLPSGHQSN
ncbi:hypothetical protein [Rhodococcus sp. NPDC049939]|uniref:hypothetical protein n=1 Tax=Rhodococcus sp. NPDC049939 TaxID=3155511 RepID=UPI0033CC49B0